MHCPSASSLPMLITSHTDVEEGMQGNKIISHFYIESVLLCRYSG